MEMMVPITRLPEFIFYSASASPYTTAPSTPRLSGEPFNYHYHCSSTPSSPIRGAAHYAQFSSTSDHSPASPGTASGGDEPSFDFEFDSGRMHGLGDLPLPEISTADELFDNGRIRPLQPPPPATAAGAGEIVRGGRGRPATKPFPISSRSRTRESRSLSPPRDLPIFTKNPPSSGGAGGSKKWRLKDFLLFRSASEGTHDRRTGSFQLTDGGGGGGGPGSAAAAHKKHFTAKRAAAVAAERKKTALAYHRPGFFPCMDFNPAIYSITKGLSGSSH